MVSFEGPFVSEAAICERTISWLGYDEQSPEASHRCITDGPSFQLAAPGLQAGRDRIEGREPFRSAHVVAIVALEDEREQAVECLLVIETARGWFASSRMIEHCERENDGSGFRPIGGFEVGDLIGDARPELLLEVGERHSRPCGDCQTSETVSRAICGVDRDGVPRCTPPIATRKVDEDGVFRRTWQIDRAGSLVVGRFPRRELDESAHLPAALPGTLRWSVDFDR